MGDRPGHPVQEETELCQAGLRRRRETPATSHRETTATAPLLDSPVCSRLINSLPGPDRYDVPSILQ
jgi:hypothetical protein